MIYQQRNYSAMIICGIALYNISNYYIIVWLRQLGCPIAQGNPFLVWVIMIYRRIAWLGKFKLKVSLHQSYHASYNKKHQKIWPNWLQTININWLFNFTHIFCYSGKSGQTALWPSLPDRATKKKGNCHSLIIVNIKVHSLISRNDIWYFAESIITLSVISQFQISANWVNHLDVHCCSCLYLVVYLA